MEKFLNWLISLFKGSKDEKNNQKENQKETLPEVKPDPVVLPSGMLTREQYVKIHLAIFDGTISVSPYNDYKYVTLREVNGNNRSKGIDALIKRQGGDLGNAYCQFGQQDKLDAVALHLGIPRKLWAYPEGGGTQRVFEKVESKYKLSQPKPACFVTVEYDHSGKGHIEDVYAVVKPIEGGHNVKTMAFNTTIDGDDSIVRDGAGAGYAVRNIKKEWKQGGQTVRLRGYVDHYAIYVDAYKKHNGII